MPLVTKILFIAVAVGLAFMIYLGQRQTGRSSRRRQQPISDARMRKLWVVDEDQS